MEERDAKGQWAKGVSGNPRGRPKGSRSLSQTLFKLLGEAPTSGELDAMFKELQIPDDLQMEIETSGDRQTAFARALLFRALCGHWSAIHEIFDRLDPKPRAIELSGRDGGPIQTAGFEIAGNADEKSARDAYLDLVRGVVEDDFSE